MYSRRGVLRAGMLGMSGGILSAAAAQHGDAVERTTLTAPDARTIAVTRWQPARRRGTILFSHGALSSPAKYDLFIKPWVSAGYEVWAPLHVDSTDHPDRAAFDGREGWRARMEDMHLLADHVGATSYVAAGHSYGALVALTLAGASPETPPRWTGPLSDHRVRAAVAFSPPAAMPGLIATGGYAGIRVPALIQTGTMDIPYAPPGTTADPASWRRHLAAYEEPAAGGHRYALVLAGVDHYFGGAICNFARPGPPQIEAAGRAAGIAGLFIDAYGRADRKARRRLDAMLAQAGTLSLTTR